MTESRSKYHAKKVTEDGFTFDSQAEARRYRELKLMVAAGEIKNLIVHPSYCVLDKFFYRGRVQRETRYIGDFQYREISTDEIVIEDVKGVETPAFRLKMKMFLSRYPHIDFRIIAS